MNIVIYCRKIWLLMATKNLKFNIHSFAKVNNYDIKSKNTETCIYKHYIPSPSGSFSKCWVAVAKATSSMCFASSSASSLLRRPYFLEKIDGVVRFLVIRSTSISLVLWLGGHNLIVRGRCWYACPVESITKQPANKYNSNFTVF